MEDSIGVSVPLHCVVQSILGIWSRSLCYEAARRVFTIRFHRRLLCRMGSQHCGAQSPSEDKEFFGWECDVDHSTNALSSTGGRRMLNAPILAHATPSAFPARSSSTRTQKGVSRYQSVVSLRLPSIHQLGKDVARLHELGSEVASRDRSSLGYNRVRRRVIVTKESPGLARACGEVLARRRGVGHRIQRLIGSHLRYSRR
jgi:hypothetical protein